jgi:hypothetical protein
MSNICNDLHHLFQNLKRYKFPFNSEELPKNGIYILFEKNEFAHNGDRIVGVGIHTGEDNLIKRLKEHLKENKDRSIFRKNIGRAILYKRNDYFLEKWNLNKNEAKLLSLVDKEKQKLVEKEVTEYIRDNVSFVVFEVKSKSDRLYFKSKIISTISLCKECKPSNHWLGLSSPIQKIRESGLWLVQGLNKTPLNIDEFKQIENLLY